jgi:hypothetical protein
MPTIEIQNPNGGHPQQIEVQGNPTDADIEQIGKHLFGSTTPSSPSHVPAPASQPTAFAPDSPYASMDPQERAYADKLAQVATQVGTNPVISDIARLQGASGQNLQAVPSPSGDILAHNLPGGGLQYKSPNGQDPFAVPGSPVAQYEKSAGGLKVRTAQNGSTRVVGANGQPAWFDSQGKPMMVPPGQGPQPVAAPDYVGGVQQAIGDAGAAAGNTLARADRAIVAPLAGAAMRTPTGRVLQSLTGVTPQQAQEATGKAYTAGAQDAAGVAAGVPSFALGTAKAVGANVGAALAKDPALKAQAEAEADQFSKDFVGSVIGAPHLDPSDPNAQAGWAAQAYKAIGYLHNGDRASATEAAKNVAGALVKGAEEHPVMTALGIAGGAAGLMGMRGHAMETLEQAKDAAEAVGDTNAADGAKQAAEQIATSAPAEPVNEPAAPVTKAQHPAWQAYDEALKPKPSPAESVSPVTASDHENGATVPPVEAPKADNLGTPPVTAKGTSESQVLPVNKAATSETTETQSHSGAVTKTPVDETAATPTESVHHSQLQPRDEEGHFSGPPAAEPSEPVSTVSPSVVPETQLDDAAPAPTKKTRPADHMAGNVNLNHLNLTDDEKALVKGTVDDLGLVKRAVKTRDTTAAEANDLGLTVDHLQHFVPGVVPKDVTSDAYGTALRQLNAYHTRLASTTGKDFAASATPENEAASIKATQDLKTATLHNSRMATEQGRALGARSINVEPTQTETVQRMLQSTPSLDDMKPKGQETPAEAPAQPVSGGKPRKGQNPAAKAYGARNKGVTTEDAAAIRERLKAKRSAFEEEHGQGIKGVTHAAIHEETGALDTETMSDLIGLGKFHIEAGARLLADFAPKIRAEWPGLNDGQVAAIYNGSRTEMANEIAQKQKQAALNAFPDQLSRRLGSRQNGQNFIEQIDAENGTHDILDALLNNKPTTREQDALVARAMEDNGKEGPKRKPSTGAMAAVDKIMGAHKAAQQQARSSPPVAGPPTPEDAFEATLGKRIGKDKVKAVRQSVGEGVFQNIARRDASPTELAQTARAYEDARGKPIAGKPATGAIADLNAAIKEHRANMAKAASAAKNPQVMGPPTPEDALEKSMAGRMGKDGATVAALLRKRVGEPAWQNLARGGASAEDLAAMTRAYETYRVPGSKGGKPQTPAITDINDALKEHRKAMAASSRAATSAQRAALPDSIIGAHVGAKNVYAFRSIAGASKNGKSALAKIESGGTLTDPEKLAVAKAIDGARSPRNPVRDKAVTNMLKGIASDTKAGRLNYDDPADMVRDYVLKSQVDRTTPAATAYNKNKTPENAAALDKAKDADAADSARLARALGKVDTLPDGTVTKKGRYQLAEIVNRESHMGFARNLGLYIKSGLLSNPATLGRIALSHMGALATEDTLNRVTAPLFDAAIGKFTGQTAVQPLNAGDTLRSAGKGIAALPRALSVVARGHNQLHMNMEHTGMTSPGNSLQPEFTTGIAPIDVAVRAPLRVHAGVYEMLGSTAYDRALRESAYVEAANEARSSKIDKSAVSSRSKELYQKPTPPMMDRARADYQQQMFMNENRVSSGLKAMTGGNPYLKAPADLAVPFDKVPSNIAGRAVEYLPAGVGSIPSALKQLWDIRKSGEPMTVTQQANLAKTLSRGVTGTALTALGYELYRQHMLNAEDQQKHEYGSANIGSRKVETSGMGPVTNPMMLGATVGKAIGDYKAGRPVNIGEAALNYLADQPMLRLNDSVNAVREGGDNKVARVGAGIASELIPYSAMLRAAAAQFDPTHSIRSKATFGDNIKNMIPGLRETLPLARDSFGHTIPEAGGLVGPVRNTPIAHPSAQQQRIQQVMDLRADLKAEIAKPAATQADLDRRRMLYDAVNAANSLLSPVSQYRQQLGIGNAKADTPQVKDSDINLVLDQMRKVKAMK